MRGICLAADATGTLRVCMLMYFEVLCCRLCCRKMALSLPTWVAFDAHLG